MGGKLPQVVDVRDESTDDVRVVLEIKRTADAETVMGYLFKHTPLENRFHVNLTCLIPTDNPHVPAPARLDLKAMLVHFLEFRMEVVTRRTQFDLDQLLKRIHILEGFELVFSDLDAAIKIIRNSDGRKDAQLGLIDYFGVTEIQADAVLETRLYRLAKLEIDAILEELEDKRAQAALLQKLLADESARWNLIRTELLEIRSAYSDPRRTKVDVEVIDYDYSEEDFIVDERCWVMVTKDGWFKRQKSYSDLSTIRVRDNDAVGWVVAGRTRQTVVFFTTMGRAYTMRIDDVPATTGYGDPLQAQFDFDDGEKVVGVITDYDTILRHSLLESDQTTLLEEPETSEEVVVFVAITAGGQSIRFALDDYAEPSTVRGRMFMRLSKGDTVVNVEMSDGTEDVAIASRHGRGLMFPVTDISFVKNAAKGVRAMQLEKDDEVLDFALCRAYLDGLEVETNRGARIVIRASKSKFEPTSRGNKGRWVIRRGHLIRSHRPPLELTPESDDDDLSEEE